MRLRNKKTGEVINIDFVYPETAEYFCPEYRLKDFVEEWEDASTDPLIKDKERLDTVRAFFALLGITKEIYYQSISNCFWHTDADGITYSIDFDSAKGFCDIDTDKPYTIAELCGEEEE